MIETDVHGKIDAFSRPGEAAGAGVASADRLERVVRILFERELQRMLLEADGRLIARDSDPLDESLAGLLGSYFPRSRRVASRFFKRVRRGLDKRRLELRVRREFYRTLYRYALLQIGMIDDPVLQSDEALRELVGMTFYQALAVLLGVEGPLEDLGRLDRSVRSTVEWCLSILPYHAPALSEQDLIPLLAGTAHEVA